TYTRSAASVASPGTLLPSRLLQPENMPAARPSTSSASAALGIVEFMVTLLVVWGLGGLLPFIHFPEILEEGAGVLLGDADGHLGHVFRHQRLGDGILLRHLHRVHDHVHDPLRRAPRGDARDRGAHVALVQLVAGRAGSRKDLLAARGQRVVERAERDAFDRAHALGGVFRLGRGRRASGLSGSGLSVAGDEARGEQQRGRHDDARGAASGGGLWTYRRLWLL